MCNKLAKSAGSLKARIHGDRLTRPLPDLVTKRVYGLEMSLRRLLYMGIEQNPSRAVGRLYISVYSFVGLGLDYLSVSLNFGRRAIIIRCVIQRHKIFAHNYESARKNPAV